MDAVNVIDTYVYRSMRSLGFSYGTAVGLMQSVLGLILVTLANHAAKKINDGEGLFLCVLRNVPGTVFSKL